MNEISEYVRVKTKFDAMLELELYTYNLINPVRLLRGGNPWLGPLMSLILLKTTASWTCHFLDKKRVSWRTKPLERIEEGEVQMRTTNILKTREPTISCIIHDE